MKNLVLATALILGGLLACYFAMWLIAHSVYVCVAVLVGLLTFLVLHVKTELDRNSFLR